MSEIGRSKQVTLLDVVEKLLDKGVVISGDLILSCGNVDLVYLNLKLVLTSVQTLLEGNSTRLTPDEKKQIHDEPNTLIKTKMESI